MQLYARDRREGVQVPLEATDKENWSPSRQRNPLSPRNWLDSPPGTPFLTPCKQRPDNEPSKFGTPFQTPREAHSEGAWTEERDRSRIGELPLDSPIRAAAANRRVRDIEMRIASRYGSPEVQPVDKVDDSADKIQRKPSRGTEDLDILLGTLSPGRTREVTRALYLENKRLRAQVETLQLTRDHSSRNRQRKKAYDKRRSVSDTGAVVCDGNFGKWYRRRFSSGEIDWHHQRDDNGNSNSDGGSNMSSDESETESVQANDVDCDDESFVSLVNTSAEGRMAAKIQTALASCSKRRPESKQPSKRKSKGQGRGKQESIESLLDLSIDSARLDMRSSESQEEEEQQRKSLVRGSEANGSSNGEVALVLHNKVVRARLQTRAGLAAQVAALEGAVREKDAIIDMQAQHRIEQQLKVLEARRETEKVSRKFRGYVRAVNEMLFCRGVRDINAAATTHVDSGISAGADMDLSISSDSTDSSDSSSGDEGAESKTRGHVQLVLVDGVVQMQIPTPQTTTNVGGSKSNSDEQQSRKWWASQALSGAQVPRFV